MISFLSLRVLTKSAILLAFVLGAVETLHAKETVKLKKGEPILVDQTGNTVGELIGWRETINDVNGALLRNAIVLVVVEDFSTTIEMQPDRIVSLEGRVFFDFADCAGQAFAIPPNALVDFAPLPPGAFLSEAFPPLIESSIAVRNRMSGVSLYAPTPGDEAAFEIVWSVLEQGQCRNFEAPGLGIDAMPVELIHPDLHSLFPPPYSMEEQ